MLIRQITAALKERRWADFFAEILIVVVGVFLGIQAANWNDDRLEREEGRLFAERLAADIRKDLDSRRALVSYYEAVIKSAEQTVKRLNSESIDDPEAFVVDAYRATEYNRISPTRATFDEIVSTGNLGLLPASARQAGIIEYYAYDNSLVARQAVVASPYRLRVRSTLPHDVQVAIRATCSDLFNDTFVRIGFNENCDLGLPEQRIKYAADLLHSDVGLLNDLRLHFSTLNIHLPNFRGEVANLEATIEALEGSQ